MLHISRKIKQDVVVLELSGRFDFRVVEHFLSTLEDTVMTHKPHHVILDLSRVPFIDSMAIGHMVTTWHKLKQQSIQFTLAGQTGYVDTALKDIRLEAMIPTASTVENAL